MQTNSHGYVSAALYLNRFINELRDHVEFEKFLARIAIDNEITQDFKKKTQEHTNSKYRFLYNNPDVEMYTAAKRKK